MTAAEAVAASIEPRADDNRDSPISLSSWRAISCANNNKIKTKALYLSSSYAHVRSVTTPLGK